MRGILPSPVFLAACVLAGSASVAPLKTLLTPQTAKALVVETNRQGPSKERVGGVLRLSDTAPPSLAPLLAAPLVYESRAPFTPKVVEPEPVIAAIPTPDPQTAPDPAPTPPDVRLIGLVAGDTPRAVLGGSDLPNDTVVALGDTVLGWTVVRISENRVTLSLERAELTLEIQR